MKITTSAYADFVFLKNLSEELIQFPNGIYCEIAIKMIEA